MQTDKENEEHVRAVHAELERYYSKEASYADHRGQASKIDPSKMTARQKLDHANRGSTGGRVAEPPLSDTERGMSEADFARLPAGRRLAIYNSAMSLRRVA